MAHDYLSRFAEMAGTAALEQQVELIKPLVIVDFETTGLVAGEDSIHEMAVIYCDGKSVPSVYHTGLAVDLENLQPVAREMYLAGASYRPALSTPETAARNLAGITRGCIWVGNNPKFDIGFATWLLHGYGIMEGWHYQADDVEARAAERLGAGPPPWNSAELSAGLGIDRGNYRQHTAIGDARWTLDQYEVLLGIDLGSRHLGDLGLAKGPSLVI